MNATDIKVKISAITAGFDEAISKVEKSLDSLNKTGEGAGATAKRWGDRFTAAGKALLPASIAAGALTGATVKLGSEYQAQMGKVQAISGATATEMNKLKNSATEATKGTKFSVIEAGQAYEYMGMAGWKSSQMIDGLTPILNLATAAGADLGITSDIVTDSLTAFGLTAKDTAMFADVLAATSTNSNTNVELMGETFKYAAPIAGALGYSVKDTAVAVGLMANAGIKGSQAGTALRSALTNMTSPTSEAAKTMEVLGVHITDSHGGMLPLRDLIGQLRVSFKGLSKEQQAQAAESLFGKEAMSGMLAIINSSEGDFNKLTSAIDNSTGSAEKMAKTMSDSDPIKKANAQIKNAFIGVGEVVMPVVGRIAEAIGKMAEGFQKLPGSVKFAIGTLVAIVAVGAPLLIFIGSILTGFAALTTVAGVLGVGVGVLAGTIGAIVAVIAGVIAIGYALWKNWDTIKAKAQALKDGISSAWEGVKSKTSAAWNGVKSYLGQSWDSIKSKSNEIFTGVQGYISSKWDNIKSNTSSTWLNIKSDLSSTWASLKSDSGSQFSGIKSLITSSWGFVKSKSISTWTAIKDTSISLMGGMRNGFSTTLDNMKFRASSGIANVKNTIVSGIREAKSRVVGMASEFVSAGRDLVAGIARGIVSGIRWVIDAAVDAVRSAIWAAQDEADINSPSRVMAKDVGRWLPAGMAVGITSNLGSVENAMRDLSDVAINGVVGIDSIGMGNMDTYQNINRVSDVDLPDEPTPMYLNLTLGGRRFKAFVKDISKIQDSDIELVEAYGI